MSDPVNPGPPLAGATGSAILPCPFCGKTPEWLQHHPEGVMWLVCPEGSPCRNSGLHIACKHERVVAATAAWNRRVVQSPNNQGEPQPPTSGVADRKNV